MTHFAMFMEGETVEQYANRVSQIYAENVRRARTEKKLLPGDWKHIDPEYWRQQLLSSFAN